MTKHVLLLLSAFVLITSCKNEDDSTALEQEQIPPNFYALAVGNTWTYEYFRRIQQTSEFETVNAFDNVEITDKTQVNGEEYFTFQTTTTGNDESALGVPENGVVVKHIRDSLGYLIEETGQIIYSKTNVGLEYIVQEHPNYEIKGKLLEGTEIIEVPAGSFTTLNNAVYTILENGSQAPGMNNDYYADEIGQILETCSTVSSPNHFGEKRLISYSIN